MRRLDVLGAREVGDRPCDLEDAVVGAGGEGELLHRLLEEIAERGFQGAVSAKLGLGHASVGDGVAAFEAAELPLAGSHDPITNRRRGLAELGRAQFGECDRRGLDVDVDPVQKGPADPRPVSLDLGGRALAPVTRIPEVPTGARVFLFIVTPSLGKEMDPLFDSDRCREA